MSKLGWHITERMSAPTRRHTTGTGSRLAGHHLAKPVLKNSCWPNAKMNHVRFQERFDFVRTLLQDRYTVKVFVTVLFVTRQS